VTRLVLVGGGHAHLHVLADLAARPLSGVDVTLVSPSARHHYSGMVPGFLQGVYE
jgi:NADH dehydrogenase FAD-containing subunit